MRIHVIAFYSPIKHNAMHPQKPGDFRHRLLVLMDELAGVGDLLGRQGRGRTKPHTSGLRRDPAGARAVHDQAALEIRDAGAPWAFLQ